MDGPYYEYMYPYIIHMWEKIGVKSFEYDSILKIIIVWICVYVCVLIYKYVPM